MKREIIITADGSTTIHLADWNENYHSKHGAIQEANHVFIKNGLSLFFGKSEISILEIGFGTGLNALLTSLHAKENNLKVNYEALEAFPLAIAEIKNINFPEQLQTERTLFEKLHQADWEQASPITENFHLKKRKQFFDTLTDSNQFELIYFDAFGPRVQPELWTEAVFKLMYLALKRQGVLVTYSSNSNARRALLSVGFQVEKLPGPPGKREMLRAVKI